MPNATRARRPLTKTLDESLATMFRRLEGEPAPASLVSLANRLEQAWRTAKVAGETRVIA
jgi:hypothetical protein